MKTVNTLVFGADPAWRKSVKDILEHEQYLVDTATTAADGINALDRIHPHLLLLDLDQLDTAEMNPEGLELLRSFQIFSRITRAIVLTSHVSHLLMAFETSYRPHRYLLKEDFERNKFLVIARDAIGKAFEYEERVNVRPAYRDYI